MSILEKIRKVQEKLELEKDGILPDNKGGKEYYSEQFLTANIKPALHAEGLVVTSDTVDFRQDVVWDKADRARTSAIVQVRFTVSDTGTGEVFTAVVFGTGSDIGGDSALSKAYTQARKVFWFQNFLVTDPKMDADFNPVDDSQPVVGVSGRGVSERTVEARALTEMQAVITQLVQADASVRDKISADAVELFRASKGLADDFVVAQSDWWMDSAVLKSIVDKYAKQG